ncbi:hypothetical protein EON81_22785 [bacterium]|nr:MAG: hypothetical protein EON81_22785 [bacterium]
MPTVPFAGFSRALAIESGPVTAIATLEVGPRILFLGETEGENMLRVPDMQSGRIDDGRYRGYGGHRLWTSPEDRTQTYAPENAPPRYESAHEVHRFDLQANAFGIAKCLEIRSLGEGGFQLRHTVRNEGDAPQRLAAWGITVMAPGGQCLFPQAEFIAHTDRLLPVRPLVLWGYARMADPRFTWGDEVVRVRQDADHGPLKIGTLVMQGIAVYANAGHTFVKRFGYQSGAEYPDMGCNFETFTRHDMLEVESLAPLKTLARGESSILDETWYLLLGETPPEEEIECARWLRELDARCPHIPLERSA